MIWKKLYRVYYKLIFDKTPKVLRDIISGRHAILNFLRLKVSQSIESVGEKPTSIWDLEWNNLVILDACRYDVYQEIIGDTEYRITKAGSTPFFIRRNYSEGNCSDIVCVTGNPHYSDGNMKEYTSTENPFLEKYNTYMHGWDEEIGNTHPEAVLEDAKKAEREYPGSKKIIHFNQPHAPFIDSPELGKATWGDVEFGEANPKKAIEGYKDNLRYLKPYLAKLLDELKGETLITADHGELLGEQGIYGHFTPTNAKGLRKVPLHRPESKHDLQVE